MKTNRETNKERETVGKKERKKTEKGRENRETRKRERKIESLHR